LKNLNGGEDDPSPLIVQPFSFLSSHFLKPLGGFELHLWEDAAATVNVSFVVDKLIDVMRGKRVEKKGVLVHT
jgi:hypothetical protein